MAFKKPAKNEPATKRPEGEGFNLQLMQWISITTAAPPEDINIVVQLESGIQTFGRNLQGRFAEYDGHLDRFIEWIPAENHPNGFHGIVAWCAPGDFHL